MHPTPPPSRSGDHERLGKVVQLALRGVGGERENALRIVRALCKRLGLEEQDVLAETETRKEYTIHYRREQYDITIAARCVLRYAAMSWDDVEAITYSKRMRTISFTTTPSRYVETVNAYETLSKLYQKERRKLIATLQSAFCIRHSLYYYGDDAPEARRKKQKADTLVALKMARDLEEAEIYKRLSS